MRSEELPPAAPPDLELQLAHSARSLVLHSEFGVARDAKHFAGHANSERTPALHSRRHASKHRGEVPRRVRALELAGASFFLWHRQKGGSGGLWSHIRSSDRRSSLQWSPLAPNESVCRGTAATVCTFDKSKPFS